MSWVDIMQKLAKRIIVCTGPCFERGIFAGYPREIQFVIIRNRSRSSKNKAVREVAKELFGRKVEKASISINMNEVCSTKEREVSYYMLGHSDYVYAPPINPMTAIRKAHAIIRALIQCTE